MTGRPVRDADERLSVAPDLNAIEPASAWARETAVRLGASNSLFFALDLCLEEALSNTIMYGFGDPPAADAGLRLSLAREETALRLTIEDNGVAFDPTAAAEPQRATDIASANVGGLGIHLLRNFTKAMTYERLDDRNRLTLWFALDAG